MSTGDRFKDLQGFFQTFKLSQFPHPKTPAANEDPDHVNRRSGVVETTSDARLRDVVSVLLKHNISSCPVRRADHKNIEGKWIDTYMGVVDLLDIVAFVLSIMKTTSKWGKGFEAVLEAVVQFAEHTVEDVMKASPTVAFQPIEESASLYDTLKLLGKDRYHRAIVIDPVTERLSNIVTQSSMLNFINSNLENPAIKAFCAQTVEELGLAKPQKMVCVPITNKAVDAFYMIQKHRVTGVPIINKDGTLVGNVSARDIRSMVGSPDKFDRLFDSLSEFLVDIQTDKKTASVTGAPIALTPSPPPSSSSSSAPASAFGSSTSSSSSEEKSSASKAPVDPTAWSIPMAVTITPRDTLAGVIRLLAAKRIHRVYIMGTDADSGKEKPVGVVTLTDVLRTFADGALGPNEHPRNSISQASAREAAAMAAAAAGAAGKLDD